MEPRKIWIDAMKKIAYPVISSLAKGTLKENLPRYFHADRAEYAALEAFGRTMCGIAPWLEAVGIDENEAAEQQEWIKMVVKAMDYATDPASPDFMNFNVGDQPLVDAAFLSHAVVRAPSVLGKNLSPKVKQNLIDALVSTRKIKPYQSNWMFFSAMVETALFVLGADYMEKPIENAVDFFMDDCYVGDGTYGDGKNYHWDYYNSFVIQPMLIDILRTFSKINLRYKDMFETELKRAARYSEVLEQMINQDGTYAVFGRSCVYRFGCFQLLSQAVLQDFLPHTLSYGQVRGALSAVIEKCMSNPLMFDDRGFLRPGIYGFQPSLAEGYISIGSLYLCCFIFLVLGLPAKHPFWTDKNEDWTAKKIWNGIDKVCDCHMD